MNPILVTPISAIPYTGSSSFSINIKRMFSPIIKEQKLYISQVTQERKICILQQFPSTYIFSTLIQKEYDILQAFTPLFNALFKRQEYINTQQFSIQLLAIKLQVNLQNSKIISFIEKEAVENDRNVAIKIIRQIDPIVLKYLTKITLNYEEPSFSQLIKNLENEKRISHFKIFKLTTFALILLDAADRLSLLIDDLQVLKSHSTESLLKDVGFYNVPISQKFSIYQAKDIQNIMQFTSLEDQINQRSGQHIISHIQSSQIFSFSQIMQIIQNICVKTNFIAIKNDLMRQNNLLKHLNLIQIRDTDQFLEFIFQQVGLILNKNNILYQLQDGLFYPLLIKLFYYKNSSISMTALNIPFQEILGIYEEINKNYDKNLENCDVFKEKFNKMMKKTRHTNIALGQSVIKSLITELSKLFKEFNIDSQSPLLIPELLFSALNNYTSFKLYVLLLVRTLQQTSSLLNFQNIHLIDQQTQSKISTYQKQLLFLSQFFLKYDYIIRIQRQYREYKNYKRISLLKNFKEGITQLQSYIRGFQTFKQYKNQKTAIKLIQKNWKIQKLILQLIDISKEYKIRINMTIKIQSYVKMYQQQNRYKQEINLITCIQYSFRARTLIIRSEQYYNKVKSDFQIKFSQSVSVLQAQIRKRITFNQILKNSIFYYNQIQSCNKIIKAYRSFNLDEQVRAKSISYFNNKLTLYQNTLQLQKSLQNIQRLNNKQQLQDLINKSYHNYIILVIKIQNTVKQFNFKNKVINLSVHYNNQIININIIKNKFNSNKFIEKITKLGNLYYQEKLEYYNKVCQLQNILKLFISTTKQLKLKAFIEKSFIKYVQNTVQIQNSFVNFQIIEKAKTYYQEKIAIKKIEKAFSQLNFKKHILMMAEKQYQQKQFVYQSTSCIIKNFKFLSNQKKQQKLRNLFLYLMKLINSNIITIQTAVRNKLFSRNLLHLAIIFQSELVASNQMKNLLKKRINEQNIVTLAQQHFKLLQTQLKDRQNAASFIQQVYRNNVLYKSIQIIQQNFKLSINGKNIIDKAQEIQIQLDDKLKIQNNFVKTIGLFLKQRRLLSLKLKLNRCILKFEDSAISIQNFQKKIQSQQFLTIVLNEFINKQKLNIRKIQNAAKLFILRRKQLSKSQFGQISNLSESKIPQIKVGNKQHHTSLETSTNTSLNSIIRSHQPFTQQPNFERIYYAVSLNSTLRDIIQNQEFTCCVLACIRLLPQEQKRAPKQNYKKFGMVLFKLLEIILDKATFKKQQILYPLSTRALIQQKRYPACSDSASSVIDAGLLLCKDQGMGSLSGTFGYILHIFWQVGYQTARIESCKGNLNKMFSGLSEKGKDTVRKQWQWMDNQ